MDQRLLLDEENTSIFYAKTCESQLDWCGKQTTHNSVDMFKADSNVDSAQGDEFRDQWRRDGCGADSSGPA